MRRSQLLTTKVGSGGDRSDLLAHAGYTQPFADGVYALLPLGQRVLARISAIVRGALDRAGAQELVMPLLQPAPLWDRVLAGGHSRAAAFGPQLFRVSDGSGGAGWVLAPSHEEVAATIAAACIRSVTDLPRVLYQVQPRFRDQACPEGSGLLRTREFVMADAYGFHRDRADLDRSYAQLKGALCAALARCGAEVALVQADNGGLGGDQSEELIMTLPRGAEVALRCEQCGYASSSELAACAGRPVRTSAASRALQEVAVRAELADEALAAELGVDPDRRLTWVPFVSGQRVVLAVTIGAAQLNAVKLRRALAQGGLAAPDLHAASAAELAALGASYDWISLVRTPGSVLICADERVRGAKDLWLPSPRAGCCLLGAEPLRDFRVDSFADLSVARDGDPCARCGSALRAVRGIEVGHVFKLGHELTAAFGAFAADSAGTAVPLELGCYGLGLTRLMAALVEARRDSRGIDWPERVAPYHAAIIVADPSAPAASEALYGALGGDAGDVMLDDSTGTLQAQRDHADLLGLPLQLIAASGAVAVRARDGGTLATLPLAQVPAWLDHRVERAL